MEILANGTINGAATELAEEAVYTITGNNSGGADSVEFTLTVIDVPPSELRYLHDEPSYPIDELIDFNFPSYAGIYIYIYIYISYSIGLFGILRVIKGLSLHYIYIYIYHI